MKKILLALFSCLIIFSGCNCITKGEVYDKQYIEAHYETYSYTTVTFVGKTPVCTPHIMQRYVPEKYDVFIREKVDGEYKTAKFSVSKERYDQIKIGDYINFDE